MLKILCKLGLHWRKTERSQVAIKSAPRFGIALKRVCQRCGDVKWEVRI